MRHLPINIISFHAAAAALTTPAAASTSPRFLPVDLSAIDKQPVSEVQAPPAAPTEADITPQAWTRRGLAALKRMEGFIGGSQLSTVRYLLKTSEEREFFALKMEELATLIEGMPVTYQQDGKGDDAICYLHYFCGGYDGYIIEKDSEPASNPAEAQWQAYGFARFAHMAESAGNGYICLPEIFKSHAELDFHFTPTPLREIKAKFGIETTPATPPEIQTPSAKPAFTHPLDALRYHVTGAIERGEGEAIVEETAPKSTGIFGGWETLSEQIPQGVILFCKVGDFYETFAHHAQLAAPLLQVALTKRNMVPMCGFPVHAMDSYIKSLTAADHCVMLANFDAATGKATIDRTFSPQDRIAENQRKFLAMDDGYQPGAIISSSWGWEQTNIDFYRIIKRSGHFVTLEPLVSLMSENNGHAMTGKKVPTLTPKDYATDDDTAWGNKDLDNPKPTFRRKLSIRDGKISGLSINHGWAKLWEAQPLFCSWYG